MHATTDSTQTDADLLVTEHLDLARHIAHRYAGRGVELDDLVQVANLAVVKAARAYDADQGAFAPYAGATIRGEIKKYFRDQAWVVRPSRRVQDLQAAITDIEGRSSDPAPVVELADALEVSDAEIVEALTARGCFAPTSIDRPSDASGATIAERLQTSETRFTMVDEWVTFCRLSRDLAPEERDLLRLRFVEDLTQQQIADRLHISQMQVSRRLRRLISGMRECVAA